MVTFDLLCVFDPWSFQFKAYFCQFSPSSVECKTENLHCTFWLLFCMLKGAGWAIQKTKETSTLGKNCVSTSKIIKANEVFGFLCLEAFPLCQTKLWNTDWNAHLTVETRQFCGWRNKCSNNFCAAKTLSSGKLCIYANFRLFHTIKF